MFLRADHAVDNFVVRYAARRAESVSYHIQMFADLHSDDSLRFFHPANRPGLRWAIGY